MLVFFIAGLIIAYLFNFPARFKAKRTIKKLNTTVASYLNERAELKSEINTLKGLETPVDGQADTMVLDMNATRTFAPETDAGSLADQTLKVDADKAAAGTDEQTETKEDSSEEKDK